MLEAKHEGMEGNNLLEKNMQCVFILFYFICLIALMHFKKSNLLILGTCDIVLGWQNGPYFVCRCLTGCL